MQHTHIHFVQYMHALGARLVWVNTVHMYSTYVRSAVHTYIHTYVRMYVQYIYVVRMYNTYVQYMCTVCTVFYICTWYARVYVLSTHPVVLVVHPMYVDQCSMLSMKFNYPIG
jgi:hypothetical protein